jgi:hypothetical protein
LFDSVVDNPNSEGVVIVDGRRQWWVAKFLKDKFDDVSFLSIEKEYTEFGISGGCCGKFENGASDMDGTIGDDWSRVKGDATKEK